MSFPPSIRVLFFDVFGTCVNQLNSVADELGQAAKEALASNPSISDEVRSKAGQMTYDQWFDFGGEWNKDVDVYVSESKTKHNRVDWKAVDQYRVESLHKLLAQRGLIIPTNGAGTDGMPGSDTGSLWDAPQIAQLARVWHRLTPWPDTCPGLELLNQRFQTATLSNTYQDLMQSLVAHSSIPFQHIFTSAMFDSFKPTPKVYLGAAEKLGVKPEECALVAAHLFDLKGAKGCGFYTIYVDRPLEEKHPELRDQNIPDLVIGQDEKGFVALAERLGINS